MTNKEQIKTLKNLLKDTGVKVQASPQCAKDMTAKVQVTFTCSNREVLIDSFKSVVFPFLQQADYDFSMMKVDGHKVWKLKGGSFDLYRFGVKWSTSEFTGQDVVIGRGQMIMDSWR